MESWKMVTLIERERERESERERDELLMFTNYVWRSNFIFYFLCDGVIIGKILICKKKERKKKKKSIVGQ